jgi:hypothetical protein
MPGIPHTLFEGPTAGQVSINASARRLYAATKDGQKLPLDVADEESLSNPIAVSTNWPGTLKR